MSEFIVKDLRGRDTLMEALNIMLQVVAENELHQEGYKPEDEATMRAFYVQFENRLDDIRKGVIDDLR